MICVVIRPKIRIGGLGGIVLKMDARLIIYTHPDCSYSDALKEELDAAGAVYDEIDLALKPSEWERIEELTGGERITPVTVEGDSVNIGFHGVG